MGNVDYPNFSCSLRSITMFYCGEMRVVWFTWISTVHGRFNMDLRNHQSIIVIGKVVIL